jgi:hypothetical protein
MKRRPFVLLCAAVSLFSAYCNRVAGGDSGITPATPHADGSPCNNPVECASFSCSGGVCVAPAGGLVEIDHACSDGDTCVGDAKCEEGLCVANSLACAADQTPCLQDDDCCTGPCENGSCGFGGDGTGGSGTCSAQDDVCYVDGDCCSGFCNEGSFCSASSSCASVGEFCAADSDCCNGACYTDISECSD